MSIQLGIKLADLRKRNGYSQEALAEKMGVSRQAVFDNLTRTEALLRRMEENIGCVKRDIAVRSAAREILEAAAVLDTSSDPSVSALAKRIIAVAQGLEE